MVQTDFVVRACVLHGRRADEAVVDQQLVVGMGAVGGEDFFSSLCRLSVLVRVCSVMESLLTCTVLSLLVRMTADGRGLSRWTFKTEGAKKRMQKRKVTVTYHNPSRQQPRTPYPSA